MEVELLLDDHRRLYVLVDAYPAAFLADRVPIGGVLRSD